MVSGDRVLVPLDRVKGQTQVKGRTSKLAARKYAPGIVINGHERRNEIGWFLKVIIIIIIIIIYH